MNKILRKRKIPVAVLRNNYIRGIDKYNYEKYMVDFINHSKLVDEKGGLRFHHQVEQSNSESDAFNGFYDIDFKILCEPKQMHALTSNSMQIYKTNTGNTAYAISKNTKPMGYYNMMKVFVDRPLILTDGNVIGDDQLLNAFNVIKKLLATKKNIMVLLPFEYYFDGCQTDEDTAKEIINKLNVPFDVMREYRITQTQCDLCFMFKSKDYMVIVEANDDISFYDLVPCTCSDLFECLYEEGSPLPVIDE